MTNVLYFDPNKVSLEMVAKTCENIHKLIPKDSLLALPYGTSLLMDVPVEELQRIKDSIDTIIEKKEKQNDI